MTTTRRKKVEAAPPIDAPKSDVMATKAKPYDDTWHRANGIPTCDRCGAPNPTDIQGNPVCPIETADCPRLTAD